jgi:hypothetical protein
MSEIIYTNEEIEILQEKIIDDIFNKCLECKKPKSNDINKNCSHTLLNFIEDDKLFLIENLQTYKIIGIKIVYKRENGMVENWGCNSKSMTTKKDIYIHYININGDVYSNTIIETLNNFCHENYIESVKDFIDYPFYIYQEYDSLQYDRTFTKQITPKYNFDRKCNNGNKYNYIEKSFILPKYLLNIILASDYFDYINVDSSKRNYINQTDIIKSQCLKNMNHNSNIYIKFIKYIINQNNSKFNSLFYRSYDLENIEDIDTTNKKEIDEYYDNIEKEKERLRQDELDRIAKEKQDELDRIAKEKQDELDRIAKEKQDKIDKENEIKRIARGNITIEKNTLIIEKNTYENINLCDFLPYKTKKICDDSGSIKNIRYTEITNITFINCKLSEISKYYTGITHLIFIKCNNFKTMSRYLKAEIKYLKINNEILFDKTEVYSV